MAGHQAAIGSDASHALHGASHLLVDARKLTDNGPTGIRSKPRWTARTWSSLMQRPRWTSWCAGGGSQRQRKQASAAAAPGVL
jgi:hypothetical protein